MLRASFIYTTVFVGALTTAQVEAATYNLNFEGDCVAQTEVTTNAIGEFDSFQVTLCDYPIVGGPGIVTGDPLMIDFVQLDFDGHIDAYFDGYLIYDPTLRVAEWLFVLVFDNNETARFTGTYSITSDAAVPVPAALPLLATGVGALGVIGWRRKRKLAQA